MSAKRCEHCGEPFTARYPTAKLCLACWRKRERALSEYDGLRLRIMELTRQLDNLAGNYAIELERNRAARIPPDVLRDLIRLAHPDKHGGSPASNRCTAWLLSQR